jgi:hypothetical protein
MRETEEPYVLHPILLFGYNDDSPDLRFEQAQGLDRAEFPPLYIAPKQRLVSDCGGYCSV